MPKEEHSAGRAGAPGPTPDDVPSASPPDAATTVAPGVGDGIVRASLWGTGVFTAAVTAAAMAPDAFGGPALLLDVVLFGAGCVLFGVALLRAADRSRTDVIGIGGLFFLAGGVAPPHVRRRLLGALVAQVVMGLGTAAARPYTNLAAGTLVPMFGLGLCGLWAARYGRFDRRPPPPVRGGGRGPSPPRPI